jgi:hypothetical protein
MTVLDTSVNEEGDTMLVSVDADADAMRTYEGRFAARAASGGPR